MRRSRLLPVVLVVAVAVAGLGACKPPVPRVKLTVNDAGFGVDDNPGDGICRAPWANYRCTFPAAIQEANALGAADIVVPAGTVYGPTSEALAITITGDVSITGAGIPTSPTTGTNLAPYDLTVAAGAKLRLSDLLTYQFFTPVSLVVEGRLDIERAFIGAGRTSLDIRPGGSVIVSDSVVKLFSSTPTPSVPLGISGTLVLTRSELRVANLQIAEGGAMVTSGSILDVDGCVAPPPVSAGDNRVKHQSCASQATDTVGVPGTDLDTWTQPGNSFVQVKQPKVTSSLIDAIPIGTHGCSTDLVDIFGNPRGVDGDGDGIGGCDVGAFERQPVLAS